MSTSFPPPAPVSRPMNPFVASAWVFAATLLFYLLSSIVFAARGAAAGMDIVSGTLCQIVAYSLVLFAILRVHSPGSGIRDFVGMRPTSVAFFPLAAVFGVAAQFPASALVDLITRRFPIPDMTSGVHESLLTASGPQRAMIALMVCVLGPLVEEVLFRGAIFGPLKKSLSTRGVILVTAVLFAFVHVKWQWFLPIGLLGACLALFRLWSGSLIVSVLAHSSFNAVTLYAMSRPQPAVEEPLPPLFVAAGTFFCVLSLSLAWFIAQRSEIAKRARELDA